MPEPLDQKLYNNVKIAANKVFTSKSGVYRSSWIVREYKKRGGKYSRKSTGTKTTKRKSSGLKRWYKEKWVDLNRPIKNSVGKIIGYKPCGRVSSKSKGSYPLCRPSKRISKKTPKTYKELGTSTIKKAKVDKRKVKGTSNIKFKRKSKIKSKRRSIKHKSHTKRKSKIKSKIKSRIIKRKSKIKSKRKLRSTK